MINWQDKTLAPLVSVFGQPAIYTRTSEKWSIEYPFSGVFDEAYEELDIADGVQTATKSPCIGINLADLPFEPKQKDQILVRAAFGAPKQDTLYAVKKVISDGHGGCRLLLNIAPRSSDRTSAKGTQDQ